MGRYKTTLRPRQQEVTIIPDDTGHYPLSGFRYVGGTVTLGGGVDALLAEPKTGQKRNRPLIVGSLVLSSVGVENNDIAARYYTGPANVNTVLGRIRKVAEVPQRFMMFQRALAANLLQIEEYGTDWNFHAREDELVQMGLLARGVDRKLIADAFGVNLNTMQAEWYRNWKQEGVLKAGGAIAAAILTGQLDKITLAPTVPGSTPGDEAATIVAAEVWDSLVKIEDQKEFKGAFQELGLAA